MNRSIYRIEIKDNGLDKPATETFYIGSYAGDKLELVRDRKYALPVDHDEHIFIMESIGKQAIAYQE